MTPNKESAVAFAGRPAPASSFGLFSRFDLISFIPAIIHKAAELARAFLRKGPHFVRTRAPGGPDRPCFSLIGSHKNDNICAGSAYKNGVI
jgi:hypothetical protein